MANYVNKDTNFSNLTITNDYPCLTGSWILKYDSTANATYYYSSSSSSTTPYTVNGVPYSGPVNFIGNPHVTIEAGATADGLVFIGSSTSTSWIRNQGTLTNSTIFNATVLNGLSSSTVSTSYSGISTGNSYVSSAVSVDYKSTSSGDYFYDIPATESTSGSLSLSQLPATSSTSFQTSTGMGAITPGTIATIANPTIINNSANPTSTITLNSNSSFGNVAANKGVLTRISNTNPTYAAVQVNKYGYYNWTAYLGDDGKTTYYKTTDAAGNSVVLTGPLNILNANSLTIEAGAVVDGCFFGATSGNMTSARTGGDATGIKITIMPGGTLQNSIMTNTVVTNQGTSYNNIYYATDYLGQTGSISDYDTVYQPSAEAYQSSSEVYLTASIPAATNLSNYSSATFGKFKVSPIYASGVTPSLTINLADGSVFNSYAGVAPRTSISAKNNSISLIQTGNVSVVTEDAITCFLTGTMIQTINGPVAVENLKVDDKVITYQDNQQGVQSIIWVGYNKVNVKTYLPEDEAGYPVRVMKDAISNGVPSSDLLVTPEHSIFFNGALVPARMLVNNLNIFYDHNITEYTYYHFELEKHSIVSADNVLTESYLDTGNRSSFISNQNVVSIVNKKNNWSIDAAAPLVTNRDFVEPIFMQLVERATRLGFENIVQDISTTSDSELYLLTESGERLEATHQNNGRFIFKLPEDTTKVSLISKTSKPSRVIGPFVDDRRNLGVLVGKVTLLEKNRQSSITEHFTLRNLSGWDVQEQTACRWTNGNAKLTLRATPSQDIGLLVIQILATPSYIVETTRKIA